MKHYLISVRKVLPMVLLALLCLACEDKADEASIVVDQLNMQFPPEGGTQTFNIECPMEWDIIRMYDNDGLDISTLHGSGNQQVSITLQPNTYKVAKQRLLAIRAANGVTKQLFVSQLGKNGSEELLDVSPSHAYISGEAGIVTSANLLCSTPRCFWTLNGDAPWLEVSTDGGKTWVSGDTQVMSQYKEGVEVLFRTTSNNEDERDRDATFVIIYGGPETAEVTISQIGFFRSTIETSGVLANSICTNWIFGSGVSEFYVLLSTKDMELSTITKAQIKKWNKYTPQHDMRLQWTNLQASTKYYIYVGSFDSKGDFVKSRRSFTTQSSQNPAIATISNLKKEGSAWTWTTEPNSNTGGYYQWIIDDISTFDYSDATLAWYVTRHFEECDIFHETQQHRKEGSGPFMVVTWCYDHALNMSGVISKQLVK